MKIKFETVRQVKFGFAATEDGIDVDFLCWKLTIKKRNYSWDTTEPRKVAIAGSFKEFLAWCIKTGSNPKMFKLIEHPEQVAELSDVMIDLYNIGSFAHNPICNDLGWNKVNVRREIYCNELQVA